MALPPYASTGERVWYWGFRAICVAIFIFLIAPILVIIPLSFNAEPYFSFSPGMLAFDPEAYSTRWYWEILRFGMTDPDAEFSAAWLADMWANAQWVRAMRNSFIIGFWATLIATGLGTVAAVGLSRSEMPARGLIMSILISPMIVPLVIIAAGLFFAFSPLGGWLTRQGVDQTFVGYLKVIFAHAALGTPFVIITVTATLTGFDKSLVRAAASLGAGPVRTFFKVQMPLILPGVISGGLFAFITSFDEVVAVLFLAGPEQVTVPRQMWSGIREQISPTILAVATILVTFSIVLLATVEILRRRSERIRGMSPG
jgi:putative spermidine/putrescine transport system permease protein